MKNLLSSIAFSVTTVAVITGVYLYSSHLNRNGTDEFGQRQGYWLILGSMTNELGFQPEDVVEEGTYINDLKTGIWKKYYPSGKLRSEITFVENRPIGKYTLYYENGVVEEQGDWQRTKNIGNFSRNYENGNVHQKFYFSDSGKRNGIQYYYHPNGKLALEVDVVNGKESGVMKRYNEDGSLQEEKSFSNGNYVNGSTKNYDKAPKEEYIPEPVEVEKDSEIKETTDTPKEEKTNSAHHFKPNGHNILYDKNRNITQSGLFKDGRLYNGKWFKYNRDGILYRVDVYRNGKFIGQGILEQD